MKNKGMGLAGLKGPRKDLTWLKAPSIYFSVKTLFVSSLQSIRKFDTQNK